MPAWVLTWLPVVLGYPCRTVHSTIQTLTTQHGELRVRLARISALVDAGHIDAVAAALAELKVLLVTHLELEDGTLYPSMAQMTRGMKKTVQVVTAETYRINMQGVSASLLAFFERYCDDFELSDFAHDWPLVLKMLLDRMESEESTLYPMYDKWSADST